MARKAAKGKAVTPKTTSGSATGAQALESGVVKLAEQLGWFVGTVQAKADGWLDSEALKQQMTCGAAPRSPTWSPTRPPPRPRG